jgi:hypothetical protein
LRQGRKEKRKENNDRHNGVLKKGIKEREVKKERQKDDKKIGIVYCTGKVEFTKA